MRHRLVHLRCHYIFDSLPPALQHVPDDQQGSDYVDHDQSHIGLRAHNGDLILVRVQRTMDLKQIYHNRWVACEPTRVYVTLQRLALEGKPNVLVQHANRGESIQLWALATPTVFPLRRQADTAYLLFAFEAEITTSTNSVAKSRIGLICQTKYDFRCLLYVRPQAFDLIRRAPGFLRRGIQALSVDMSRDTTITPGLPGPRGAYREAKLVPGTLSFLTAEPQRGLRGRSSASSQSSQSSRVSGFSRSSFSRVSSPETTSAPRQVFITSCLRSDMNGGRTACYITPASVRPSYTRATATYDIILTDNRRLWEGQKIRVFAASEQWTFVEHPMHAGVYLRARVWTHLPDTASMQPSDLASVRSSSSVSRASSSLVGSRPASPSRRPPVDSAEKYRPERRKPKIRRPYETNKPANPEEYGGFAPQAQAMNEHRDRRPSHARPAGREPFPSQVRQQQPLYPAFPYQQEPLYRTWPYNPNQNVGYSQPSPFMQQPPYYGAQGNAETWPQGPRNYGPPPQVQQNPHTHSAVGRANDLMISAMTSRDERAAGGRCILRYNASPALPSSRQPLLVVSLPNDWCSNFGWLKCVRIYERLRGTYVRHSSGISQYVKRHQLHVLLCDSRGHISVAVLPSKLLNVNLIGRFIAVCRERRPRRLVLRNTGDRLLQQLELRGRSLRLVEIVNTHLLTDPPRQKPVSVTLLHLVWSGNAMYAICDHDSATVGIKVEDSNISWMSSNPSFQYNGRIVIAALPSGSQVRLGTEKVDVYDRLIVRAPRIAKLPAYVPSAIPPQGITFRLGPVVQSLYRNGAFHCLCPTECSGLRPHVHDQDDRYAIIDVMPCLPKAFGFRRGHEVQLRLTEMGFLFIESPLNSSTHQPQKFLRARMWTPLPGFERTNSTAARTGLSARARGKQPINIQRRGSWTSSAASQKAPEAGPSSHHDPLVNDARAQTNPGQSSAPEAQAGPSAYPDHGARSAYARRERNVTWEERAGGSSSSDDLYVPINRPQPHKNLVQRHHPSPVRRPRQDRQRSDDRPSRPRVHRTGTPGARQFRNRQHYMQDPVYASYPDYPPPQQAAHFDQHRPYQQQMPPYHQQMPPYQQHMPPYQPQYGRYPPYEQNPAYPPYPTFPQYGPYNAQYAPYVEACYNPQPLFAQRHPAYPAGLSQAAFQDYRPTAAASRTPKPMRAQMAQQAPVTAEFSSPRTIKTGQIDGRTVHHASYETAEESSEGGAPIRETKKKKQGKQPQR